MPLSFFHSSLCHIFVVLLFYTNVLDVMQFLQAVAELGPVDMLVNAAGIAIPGEFDVLTVDQLRVSVSLTFILW